MGVYIKGMEMPDVKDFPFECFFRCVNYTNTKFVIKKDGEEQVYDLVEIPEPHGRLIDADKLYSVIERHHDLFKGATNTNDMARRDEDLQVMSDIVNAPKVIEAEE